MVLSVASDATRRHGGLVGSLLYESLRVEGFI